MTKIERDDMKKQCTNPAKHLLKVDVLTKDMPLCGVHLRSLDYLKNKAGVEIVPLEKSDGAVCTAEVLSEAKVEE